MQYRSNIPAGRGQFTHRSSSATLATNESADPGTYDPLIGRKVLTRWPEDNNFYEAVITDYNPLEVCPQFWKCFLACLSGKYDRHKKMPWHFKFLNVLATRLDDG